MLARIVDLALDLGGADARHRGHGCLAVAGAGCDEVAEHRSDGQGLIARLAGDLAGDVVLGDVTDFVRQYGGQFALALRGENQAGVDAHMSAGQGKGVELPGGHGKELEGFPGCVWVGLDQASSKVFQVSIDLRVVEPLAAGAQALHALCSKRLFHLRADDRSRCFAQFRQLCGIGDAAEKQGDGEALQAKARVHGNDGNAADGE